MSVNKTMIASRIVLALVLPCGLAACGSAASAPNPATGASASLTGAAAGGATGGVGSSGGSGGVASGGAAGGSSGGVTGSGSLTDPVGVTVLNTGLGSPGSLVQANVLSNTPVSNAPVQANVLANGQVVSASVASPGSDIPVVSPLVSSTLGAVASNTGLPVPTSADALASPAADVIATSEGVQKLGSTIGSAPVPAPLNGVTGAAGSAVTQVGASLPATVLELAAASAPLNPLLNVSVGGTTLIGSPAGGSALTVGVDESGKILNTALTTPQGVPNPVDKLNSTLANSGAGAVTGALSPVTTPLNTALTSGNPLGGNPLGGIPLGGVTGALTGLPAASMMPVSLNNTTTSTTAVTSPLGTLTGTLSGTLNGVLK